MTKPSLDDYQKAIGKAISELAGTEYHVHIANLTREPKWAGRDGMLGSSGDDHPH